MNIRGMIIILIFNMIISYYVLIIGKIFFQVNCFINGCFFINCVLEISLWRIKYIKEFVELLVSKKQSSKFSVYFLYVEGKFVFGGYALVWFVGIFFLVIFIFKK